MFFTDCFRYLNTHYVKKRHTNELDTSYTSFECNNDNNDAPLVEIGEVNFRSFNQFDLIHSFQMALDCWTKIIIDPLKDRLVKLLLEQIHLFVNSLSFIQHSFFVF